VKNSLLVLVILSIFSGCGGTSKYYHLYPTIPVKKGSYSISKRMIGVAEIKLADYIDKPQIVTRKEKALVDIHEKDNWAGDFSKNIQMVVTQNLNRLIKKYTFVALPSEEVTDDKYRLFLTIDRFDGDDSIKLQGHWSLKNINSSTTVVTKAFNYSLTPNPSVNVDEEKEKEDIKLYCRNGKLFY